jgi:hypothetical protein
MATTTKTPATQLTALIPYTEPTQAETDRDRGILLQRVMNLYPGWFPWILGALDAVEDLSDSEAPAEKFVSDVLADYALGHLTVSEAQAEVDEYEFNVKNLAEETRTEPVDDSPAAKGEAIRKELRRVMDRSVRNDFRAWARNAGLRDLTIVQEILNPALSVVDGGEFNAAFLCGIANVFGRKDIVFCPTDHVSCVEKYVEQLTAKEAA